MNKWTMQVQIEESRSFEDWHDAEEVKECREIQKRQMETLLDNINILTLPPSPATVI
jgi:hypothetical protein